MRVCFSALLDYSVKTVVVDGVEKHQVEGPGADILQNSIDFISSCFGNVSFHFGKQAEECEERMLKNLSDFSNALSVVGGGWKVPIAIFADKTTIMSGYNATDIKKEESASALTNFTLFGLDVYICALALTAMLTLLVVGYIMIRVDHRGKETSQRARDGQMKGRRQKKLNHVKFVSREVKKVYDGSTNRFKFISLLLALLLFSLAAYFSGLYQTSQVVLDEPTVVKSYSGLIAHATAFPIFFDGVIGRSQEFKDAKRDSSHGEVWQKFMRLDVNSRHVYKELLDPNVLKEAIEKTKSSMFVNKSVAILASTVGEPYQVFFCSCSPENELWRFVLNYDDNEREQLIGYPVSPFFNDKRFSKLRMTIEGGLYLYIRRDRTIFQQLGALLGGTGDNPAHLREQNYVCSDEFEHEAVNSVNQLPVEYYKLFFLLFLCCLALAFVALAVEMLVASIGQRVGGKEMRGRAAPLPFPPLGERANGPAWKSGWRVNPRPGSSR